MLFVLYLSPRAAKTLGADIIVQELSRLLDLETERFEKRGMPGEFSHFGGPRGAAAFNLNLALLRYPPNTEIYQRLIELIPELA